MSFDPFKVLEEVPTPVYTDLEKANEYISKLVDEILRCRGVVSELEKDKERAEKLERDLRKAKITILQHQFKAWIHSFYEITDESDWLRKEVNYHLDMIGYQLNVLEDREDAGPS